MRRHLWSSSFSARICPVTAGAGDAEEDVDGRSEAVALVIKFYARMNDGRGTRESRAVSERVRMVRNHAPLARHNMLRCRRLQAAAGTRFRVAARKRVAHAPHP
jgi:hypothetical protein